MDRQCNCTLSKAVRQYLAAYRRILDEMRQGMTGASLTESISQIFIVQMIPHHRAAIEMSENILRYTCNPKLRQIASNIVCMQTKSIADMRKVLDAGQLPENPGPQIKLYQRRMNQIYETMFARMGDAPENNCLDAVFMREMIPHHEGAIQVAENTLKYPICPGLEPILCEIIRSQCKGVKQMRELLHSTDAC